MKRYFSGLLALIVLALMLAACGDSNATPVAAPAPTTSNSGTSSLPTAPVGSMTTAAATTAAMTTAPATTVAGSSNGGSGSDMIAAPSGATSVAAPAGFSQSFESSYLQSVGASGATSGFQFSYYSISDTADNVLTYYDGAVTKAGFTKGPSQTLPPTSLGSTSVNAKTNVYLQTGAGGAAVYQVIVVGPLDATSAQAVGGDLQAGQSLLITAHGKVATTAASGTATAATGSTGSSTGNAIAPYSGLTAISAPTIFSQPFQSSYLQSLGAAASTGGFQFNYFTTADSSDKVLAYYDGAAAQAGYIKSTSQATPPVSIGAGSVAGNTSVYVQQTGTSGGLIYQVIVFGPLDATTALAMSATGTTFNAGDSLVIITQGSVTAS